MRLDQLPFRTLAVVTAIDWHALGAGEARRLRHLGFDDGVEVGLLHRAPFGGDPLAVRVGRMTVAMRCVPARAVLVERIELQLAAE